ncbi:hypothetical protein NL676_039524 [Syzygium grande]|nr:hypothetical protein NL676_039524 [Syzygium grande]
MEGDEDEAQLDGIKSLLRLNLWQSSELGMFMACGPRRKPYHLLPKLRTGNWRSSSAMPRQLATTIGVFAASATLIVAGITKSVK